ncbi:hypothetical protein FOA43_002782 [Brettanomyces nanus]|uniref:Uncharacterized protein n=1 Tax=Eeniella nana TaxID=13502 RepID=A0A875S3A7_EENNA|nr:uncharacterized protein FOA43_002782 [Brettanomyces nanus]QPG75428.1 hypothetical protein FOA43_002782 [Brettanomyces nanus]
MSTIKTPTSPLPKLPDQTAVSESSTPVKVANKTPADSPSRASINTTTSKNEVSSDSEIFTSEINACCLHYLVNECVPLSMRVQEKLMKNETDLGALMKNLKLKDQNIRGSEEIKEDTKSSKGPSDSHTREFLAGRVDYMNDEKYLDVNSLYRIEGYGFEIGFKITDCLIYDKSVKEGLTVKMVDSLEILKFICRDVWKVFYGKQMDNLRTNHLGTFVLIDNAFKPLTHFYSGKGEEDTLNKVTPFLQFPSGLIRGILWSLSVESVVKAEVINGKVPGISFTVQTNFDTKE